MKKILYFIMFILGIVAVLCLWFLPFYHFDAEKSLNNNTEYIYLVDIAVNDGSTLFVEETDVETYENANEQGYLSSSTEDQETFKSNYEKQMKAIYALMNNQEEVYYDYYEFEILNQIKKDLISEYETIISDTTDSARLVVLNDNLNNLKNIDDLNFNSTDNELKSLKEVLNPSVGILQIVNTATLSLDDRIANIKTTMMKERRDKIINYLSNGYDEETAKAVALEVTTAGVVDVLFLGLEDEAYGSEIYVSRVEKYEEKGIGCTLVLTMAENAYGICKAYLEDNADSGKTTFELIKEAILVEYNIFPGVIIILTLLLFFIINLVLVFGGLRGMNGRNYPNKTFIFSLVGLACTCVLLFINNAIDETFWLGYSYAPQMLKLKQMFVVGTFDTSITISAVIYFVAVIISILGRFCNWSKKKKRKNKED